MTEDRPAEPAFVQFAPPIRAQSRLRRAITAAFRRPEPVCLAALIDEASLPDDLRARISATARDLVLKIRAKGQRGSVEGLMKEYALSSDEGVALMCMAEALLRIPDNDTRDALIRDKIAAGNWKAHLGEERSLFVNAATWGLVVSGKLTTPVNEQGLGASLTRLIARAGEPVVRGGVNMAMELLGDQFVCGETIGEALRRSRKERGKGFTYSYDMLGEAASTMADAQRYTCEYEAAIHAIGKVSKGLGVHAGPGISVKLSALHPRYSRAKAGRVVTELLPRLRELASLAAGYDIGFNIDAEEADRLELSLDLLEELAFDPALAGWNGLGFVVQAYGKRCPFVIDWIVDLARRSGRRIMVRLVKGAYWDSEIKRAQVDGLADFPVYTRKVHTDLSYIACARRLLAARDAVFPQFATHNAQTVATILHLAREHFTPGDFEFQCLHGMGEVLYEQVVGEGKLDRPCRIYAPVGTHETLLAYLVRRLLENGANSSFVNRIWDHAIPVEALTVDPAQEALAIEPPGSPHPLIRLPGELFDERVNSAGCDLVDESVLAGLSVALRESSSREWLAAPMIAGLQATRHWRDVVNPADRSDLVGKAAWALERDAAFAARVASEAAPRWAATPLVERASCLERAADLMQARATDFHALAIREVGKAMPNAVSELREAVDFLRYYAVQARSKLGEALPVGPVVCISPWNFPLAIFTGQIAAALVAGNPVLAKPAEETPLIAAVAIEILHEAGIPPQVLQLLPGDGAIGAALVSAPQTCGVIFTGSTEVARLIHAGLAGRLLDDGSPLVLIAETGGQNAMIVDSSALPEQVVGDVIASAFDSAGQRCSALRVLCVQDDVVDTVLAMLYGAMAELAVGRPDRLAVDLGPVISAEARDTIEAHIARMRASGCRVTQLPLPPECELGTFVAPTIIEIDWIDQLEREVFGPVLHVLRYRREELDAVIEAINATGYGLTFGLHTRIGETIEHVTGRIGAGNVYINRNVIGAVVGVQPFGGRGLSGTGPKAGGPLYLGRLVRGAGFALGSVDIPPLGGMVELQGPVGERNLYALHPRGRTLLLAVSTQALSGQLTAIRATGNTPCVADIALLDAVAPELAATVERLGDWRAQGPYTHVLLDPDMPDIPSILREIAQLPGPIPIVQVGTPDSSYRLDWMVEEVATSINTTAAGGNASLMALV